MYSKKKKPKPDAQVVLKLSNTPRAAKWLKQFETKEQQYLKLLLDSLLLVPQDDFLKEIQYFIEKKGESAQKPIALIPIRKFDGTDSYYSLKNKNTHPPKITPGSEALTAHIAERLKRLSDFLSRPSLKILRNKKCRSIFFLDDIIGSGARVRSFLDVFERHPTIKSWYSYHRIRFFIIVYAATDSGISEILKRKRIPEIRYLLKCPTFKDQNWSANQICKIEDLCKKYAKDKEMALGYKDTRGMLIFEHSVPNNVPGILWQTGGKVDSLFPERAVPSELASSFYILNKGNDLKTKISKLKQKRLSEGAWLPLASSEVQKIIFVLSSIARKARNLEQISFLTGLSTIDAEKILTKCRDLGFINDSNHITKTGLREIEHARRLKADVKNQLALPDGFYYPLALRKSRTLSV